MVFGRRKERGLWQKIIYSFWPRTGWERAFRYFGKRVLRLSATPHAVGLGVACGVFVSFTPFIGLHFILGAVLAYLIGGNLLASAFGTVVGNPLTFPFIWGATFRLGTFIMGTASGPPPEDLEEMVEPSLTVLQALWPHTLQPMLIGSVPIGLAVAGVAYLLVRASTATYQNKRRARLERQAAARIAVQEKRLDATFEENPTIDEHPS